VRNANAFLRVQDELGFAFASDCRDGAPFYPAIDGGRAQTLQIPTTLPTSDELLATGAARAGDLASWYDAHLVPDHFRCGGPTSRPRGIHFAEWLRGWVDALRARVAFVSRSRGGRRSRARARRNARASSARAAGPRGAGGLPQIAP
jgi:hypothetical protein